MKREQNKGSEMHFIKTKYWQILDLQENTDKNVGNMEDIVRENLTFIQSESQGKRMNGSEKIVEETVTDYFQCFPEAMKKIFTLRLKWPRKSPAECIQRN